MSCVVCRLIISRDDWRDGIFESKMRKTQSSLLARNSQNPNLRRAERHDATNQAATTVTSMAGH